MSVLKSPWPSRRQTARGRQNAPTTAVQLLALNDFHGQLEALPATATSGARVGNLTDINPDPNVTNLQCVAPGCVPAGGAEFLATHLRDLAATNPNSVDRVGGRQHRRNAPAVGALPRRADHRGTQPDGSRNLERGQPRVRRGSHRAAANAERWLPSGRRVRRWRWLQRCGLPVPVGQRGRQGHERARVPALCDQAVQGRQGRVRRHDPRGHAPHRLAGWNQHRQVP